jgi:hypothetical protein
LDPLRGAGSARLRGARLPPVTKDAVEAAGAYPSDSDPTSAAVSLSLSHHDNARLVEFIIPTFISPFLILFSPSHLWFVFLVAV